MAIVGDAEEIIGNFRLEKKRRKTNSVGDRENKQCTVSPKLRLYDFLPYKQLYTCHIFYVCYLLVLYLY